MTELWGFTSTSFDLFVVALALAVGAGIRLLFLGARSTDEWGAWWYVQQQEGERWINLHPRDGVIAGIRGYPVLAHFLLARIRPGRRVLAGHILNVLYDVATALLLLVTPTALQLPEWESGAVAGLSVPVLAVLLFVTMPILTPATARMRSIGGRSLGLLFTTGYFVTVGGAVVHDALLWLVPAIVLGVLVVLTSMFGLQALVFVSVFLSVFLPSAVPVVTVGLVLVLSYLFHFLGTRDILRHYVHHKIWYFRNAEFGTTATGRNRLKDYVTLPIVAITRPRRLATLIFKQLPWLIAVYSVPAFFLLFVFWLVNYEPMMEAVGSTLGGRYLWGMALGSGFAFAVTSIRTFSFLGQAERYFEYGSPAIALLAAYVLATPGGGLTPQLVWPLVLTQLLVTLTILLYLRRGEVVRNATEVNRELGEVIEFFEDRDDAGGVLTIPAKEGQLLSVALSGRGYRFYYRFVLREGDVGFRDFERDTANHLEPTEGSVPAFDVVTLEPGELARRYDVTYIVINRRYLSTILRNWEAQGAVCHPSVVFENATQVVYQLDPAQTESVKPLTASQKSDRNE